MAHDFEKLMINESLIKGLKAQGITKPTPVQELVILPFMEGKDLITESYTGSGKTLAFVLPLFMKTDPLKRELQAIILAPTHELVMQIHHQITLLAKNAQVAITSCPIMGEVNIEGQIKKLKEKPQIVVGTAGRILDLIVKKKLIAHTVKTLVLDEADNLLDQNQANTVKKLIYSLPKERQICLFSASISKQTLESSRQLLTLPTILRTASETMLNPNIEHLYALGEQREKFDLLKKILAATKASRTLIFVNQNTDTLALVEKLTYHGYAVATISGKLTKEDRKSALSHFRGGKVNLLISSDLAARGLDVPDITHVIHFDLPLTAHDYLHRAGRSARGLKSGTSICLITPKDLGAIRVFEKAFGIKLTPIKLLKGQIKSLASGEVLPTASTSQTTENKKAAKKHNKYPKGFSSSQKNNTSPKAAPKKEPYTEASIDQPGSLKDALALIAEDSLKEKR